MLHCLDCACSPILYGRHLPCMDGYLGLLQRVICGLQVASCAALPADGHACAGVGSLCAVGCPAHELSRSLVDQNCRLESLAPVCKRALCRSCCRTQCADTFPVVCVRKAARVGSKEHMHVPMVVDCMVVELSLHTGSCASAHGYGLNAPVALSSLQVAPVRRPTCAQRTHIHTC